jgi:HSP20 family protein
MAGLTVRTIPTTPFRGAPVAFEPFELVRQLLEADPFREMSPGARWSPESFSPHFDVKETSDGFFFKADLPGLDEKDVEVTLTGTRLTITGRREVEQHVEGETYYACERHFGTFSRSFTLPEGLDANNIEAELRQGVLTVHLPKTPEVKPKKISIRTVAEKVRGVFENKEKATA